MLKNIFGRRGISVLALVGYIFLIGALLGLLVPPLQRAVAYQWAQQMETLIKMTVDAQRQFFAKNKKFAMTFQELNLQIESPARPATSEIGLVVPTSDSNRTFPHYEILINTLPPAQFESVTGALISGHYRAAGLTYVFRDLRDGNIPLNRMLCFEVDDYRYTAAKGGFCERIMGYKYYYTSKFWVGRFYVNPKDGPVVAPPPITLPTPAPVVLVHDEPGQPEVSSAPISSAESYKPSVSGAAATKPAAKKNAAKKTSKPKTPTKKPVVKIEN